MLSEERSLEIIELALSASGADEADAELTSSDRNISRFANSNLHQNMSEISAEMTIRVIVDGKQGLASTSSIDSDAIRNAADLALTIARNSEPLAGFQGLYTVGEPLPESSIVDAETKELKPGRKAELLRDLFETGRSLNTLFAGSFATATGAIATGNTHGIRRYASFTSADAVVIALRDGDSGFATRASRNYRNVDLPALGLEALEKVTLSADSRQELPPGTYDVIIEPAALAEVFEWMNMVSFSGKAYEDQSSFFAGAIGQQKLGDNFTISEDPTESELLPFPFDMEGLPKRRVPLVEKGIIRTPVLDKLLADRLGLEPTASAAGLGSSDHGTALHLCVDPGTSSREEMLATTERGIWITRFHYVNGLLEPKTATMTGMTRDGTFLIEGGRVTARLPNLRWTQSMTEAFSNIESLSRERRAIATWWNPIGGTLAPTMKIRGWNFGGGGA